MEISLSRRAAIVNFALTGPSAAAPIFAVQTIAMPIQEAGTIEKAIEAFAREANGGLMVLPDITMTVHEKLIVELAGQHRLPAIYPWRHFVTVGGLMCYAADLPVLWRRAASYVDQVLKGEKPANLLSSSWSSISRPLRRLA